MRFKKLTRDSELTSFELRRLTVGWRAYYQWHLLYSLGACEAQRWGLRLGLGVSSGVGPARGLGSRRPRRAAGLPGRLVSRAHWQGARACQCSDTEIPAPDNLKSLSRHPLRTEGHAYLVYDVFLGPGLSAPHAAAGWQPKGQAHKLSLWTAPCPLQGPPRTSNLKRRSQAARYIIMPVALTSLAHCRGPLRVCPQSKPRRAGRRTAPPVTVRGRLTAAPVKIKSPLAPLSLSLPSDSDPFRTRR